MKRNADEVRWAKKTQYVQMYIPASPSDLGRNSSVPLLTKISFILIVLSLAYLCTPDSIRKLSFASSMQYSSGIS